MKYYTLGAIFPFLIFTSLSINQNTLISNANAAEPMTIIGIYVHGFFLLMAVGLPYLVLTYEFLGIRRKDYDYLNAAKRLSAVWGISFAIGAATGTLVEFGLVQVWSGTLVAIGSFFFAPLTIELFAFMVEVVFVVIYLFTWDMNKPSWFHFSSGFILLIASNLSAYLILAANAFMNVPWGTGDLVQRILPWMPALGGNYVNQQALANLYFELQNKGSLALIKYSLGDNIGIIFYNPMVPLINPDLYATFLHTVLATIIIASFEASAFIALDYIRRKNERPYRFKLLKISYGVGAIASILMAFSGDFMGRIVYQYNVLKFVAFEGLGNLGGKDPVMGILLYGDPNHIFPGFNYYLNYASSSVDPNAVIQSVRAAEAFAGWGYYVYWSMVISGIILFIFSLIYLTLYSKRLSSLFQRIFRIPVEKFIVYSSFVAPLLGIVAASAGWAVREAGRHPWVIYGLLQYWQVITPDTITFAFSTLIIVVEISILILGSLAILYVMRFRRDKNE
ncbi:MAG: cytochrome ubiquinol oxidase subunit I [Thermoplasmata archaeon]